MPPLTTEVVSGTDSLDENSWNNLVDQSELGSVFHRTEWLGTIEAATDSDPRHIVVKDDGNYVGLLPNFITAVDIPFSVPEWIEPFVFRRLLSVAPGFGGPVVVSDEDDVIRQLFGSVPSVCSGNVIVHRLFTPDTGHVRYARYLEQTGYSPSVLTCRFVLDITRSWEAIKSDFDRGRRRNIRRGEEYDSTVTHTSLDLGDVPDFYDTYTQNMKRTGGDVFPEEFFRMLATKMGERVELFTFAVDSEPLAYHLLIRDDPRDLLIDFFVAADEQSYDYYPHEILTKHIVKWAKDEGFERYSLGSTKAHYDDGIYNFKSQFGGDVKPVLAWERGYAHGRWSAFKLARWAYRRRNLVT